MRNYLARLLSLFRTPAPPMQIGLNTAPPAAAPKAKRPRIVQNRPVQTSRSDSFRFDGLVNQLSGLGTAGDKGSTGEIDVNPHYLSDLELASLYRTNGYARRIVDIVATDCTRKGWYVQDPSDDVDPMADEDARLQVTGRMCDAIRIARIYGSCMVFLVADEVIPPEYRDKPREWLKQPLDPDNLLRIANLVLLDTLECNPIFYDSDQRSPNFGNPYMWNVSAQSGNPNNGLTATLIHWTRIIKIDGDFLGRRQQITNRGHGASVLQTCWEPIRNLTTIDQAGATHSQELSIPVLKVGNLNALSASDQATVFNLKQQIIARSKSLLNLIMLNGDDDYIHREISLSGFDKVAERAREALSAASKMPAIIIHGDPPGGLGTDGESHRALWGQVISGAQKEYLTPALKRLYTYLYAQRFSPTKGVTPKKWEIIYHPLDELTEQGKIELQKIGAEVDKMYIELGVYTAEDVRKSRFGPRGYQTQMLPIGVVSAVEGTEMAAPPVADRTYNGAQVTSALEIVTSVNGGVPPSKEQGIAMLSEFFNVSKDVATQMIGGAAPVAGTPPVTADAVTQIAPPSTPPPTNIPLRMQIPTGDIRRGIGPDGSLWMVTMPADYGEIPGTHGLDGEPVDYLLVRGGPRGMAFVAEQLLPNDGEPESELARMDSSDQLDEYKVIFGCADINSAKALLESVYNDTSNFGAIHPVPEESLLDWLRIRSERAPHLALDAIDMSPPKGVREELKRGLEWHEAGKSGKGLVPATVAWARRLASGQPISPAKAVKMHAWLARHEVDKKGQGYKPGEEGFPSPGRVAWALWGGDAAVAWSNKLVGQIEAAKRK